MNAPEKFPHIVAERRRRPRERVAWPYLALVAAAGFLAGYVVKVLEAVS